MSHSAEIRLASRTTGRQVGIEREVQSVRAPRGSVSFETGMVHMGQDLGGREGVWTLPAKASQHWKTL